MGQARGPVTGLKQDIALVSQALLDATFKLHEFEFFAFTHDGLALHSFPEYSHRVIWGKLFLREPQVQARHDLKRFKMLMETGEIATSARTRDETRAAKQENG